MWRLTVLKNKNRGVTLVETLVVSILIGVLAAISLPNLLEMYNNNKTKAALDELQNTLRDSQRQAIRKGSKCTLELGNYNNNTWMITNTFPQNESEENCLLSYDESVQEGTNRKVKRFLEKGIKLNTNLNNSKLSFSFKGNTTDSGTIVLSPTDGSGEKRCLTISNGVGIIRTGMYKDNNLNAIDGDRYCQTTL